MLLAHLHSALALTVLFLAIATLGPSRAGGVTLLPGDIVVADEFSHSLLRIDPITGLVETISAGGLLSTPYGIAQAADGAILVMETNPDAPSGTAIITIDPTSGSQTVLAAGSSLFGVFDIATEPSGQIVAVDSRVGSVLRIDAITGSVTVLSSNNLFVQPLGIAVSREGDLYVADISIVTPTNDDSGVIKVDPITGVQTQLASGGYFQGAQFLAVAGDDLFVSDFVAQAIVRVDRQTGAQTLVTSSLTRSVAGIAVEASGDLLVADGQLGVLRINPLTGAVSVVAPDMSFPGGLLNNPHGILVYQQPIPEPSTVVLLAPGLLALAINRRRFRGSSLFPATRTRAKHAV